MVKINNKKSTTLFGFGAEVLIIGTHFCRKVGCMIDNSETQECVGIGGSAYMTIGHTKIEINLDESLVYSFDVWVGDQVGYKAILGMNFMLRACIRLDLANKTICLQTKFV